MLTWLGIGAIITMAHTIRQVPSIFFYGDRDAISPCSGSDRRKHGICCGLRLSVFQDTAFIDSSGTDVVCKRGKNISVFAVFFIELTESGIVFT